MMELPRIHPRFPQTYRLRRSAEPAPAVSEHSLDSKQLFWEPPFASLPQQTTLHLILHPRPLQHSGFLPSPLAFGAIC